MSKRFVFEQDSVNYDENNDVKKDAIFDVHDSMKVLLLNAGDKIHEIADNLKKFLNNTSKQEDFKSLFKGLFDDISMIVDSEPVILGMAIIFTAIMLVTKYGLSKILRRFRKNVDELDTSVRSILNIKSITNMFVKTGVKISVMVSSVYLLRKIFIGLKTKYPQRLGNLISDEYKYIGALNIIDKLLRSEVNELKDNLKQKFGRRLLESTNILSKMVKIAYSIIWFILVLMTNVALSVSLLVKDRLYTLKIVAILTALGISKAL